MFLVCCGWFLGACLPIFKSEELKSSSFNERKKKNPAVSSSILSRSDASWCFILECSLINPRHCLISQFVPFFSQFTFAHSGCLVYHEVGPMPFRNVLFAAALVKFALSIKSNLHSNLLIRIKNMSRNIMET